MNINPELIAMGFIWYVVFLLSLTCHEASHALVAAWGGDRTAAEGGQVTLNPIPHIRREPFGTVLVPILSYIFAGWMIGWGSAPYDPTWSYKYPKRAAWMALAGPTANTTLMLLAVAGIHIGVATKILDIPYYATFTRVVVGTRPGFPEALAVFLSILFSLNLLLATFNLLPVPPLDGNAVVGLFLSEGAARKFSAISHSGGFAMIGLVIGWTLFNRLFAPLFNVALNVLYSTLRYH